MLVRQAAGVVLLVLVAKAAAAGDKDKDTKPLDLGSVRAHEKQVDIKFPGYKSLALVQQHNESIATCTAQIGPNSLIDGSGGCVCTKDHVLSEEGMCVHKSVMRKPQNLGIFGGFFRKKREHDDVPDLPECKGKEDCDAKLQEHYTSLDTKAQGCAKQEVALISKVEVIKAALFVDEQNRADKTSSVHEWIMLMRSQNKMMVGQLKRYKELDADNKRLSRDMDNVMKDRRSLDDSVRSLQTRKAELENELAVLNNEGDTSWNDCQETLRKLRSGLTSRGIAVPKLE